MNKEINPGDIVRVARCDDHWGNNPRVEKGTLLRVVRRNSINPEIIYCSYLNDGMKFHPQPIFYEMDLEKI